MSAEAAQGPRPLHVLRALPALVSVGFAQATAWRAELVIWILTALMPLIMMPLWIAVVREQPAAGFGPDEMARYFTATLIVRQLTGAWLFWRLSQEIRSGDLSQRLLRPLHPLWWDAAQMIAAIPWRLAVLTPIVLALVTFWPAMLAFPGWDALALFVISVSLAWCMAFLMQAIFAMGAFWLDQTDGLFSLYFTTWMLLSGYIAPLALFPEWAQTVANYLPFRGMLGVPVELLGGFSTPAELWPDVLVQVAWVIGLWVITMILWKRGIARFGAFGA